MVHDNTDIGAMPCTSHIFAPHSAKHASAVSPVTICVCSKTLALWKVGEICGPSTKIAPPAASLGTAAAALVRLRALQ